MGKNSILVAACLALLAAGPAHALTFGEVVVTVDLQPRGACTHGSSEYVFSLHNESTSRAHVVTLTIPVAPGGSDDRIVSISRTVTLEPDKSARVSLLQPFFPPIFGSSVKVVVDGREYGTAREPALPLNLSASGGPAAWGGPAGWPGGGPGGGNTANLLISREVPRDFPTLAEWVHHLPEGLRAGANAVAREDVPLSAWSPNWQGYTRYDAVVVAAREWNDNALPEAVRTALWQYAETGGFLLFLGDVTVPERLKTQAPRVDEGVRFYPTGFGTCAFTPDDKLATWPVNRWWALHQVWANGPALQPTMSAAEANDRFPVVEDIQTPVRGLFVLMVVFTLVIGPGNLWVLSRMQRRIWMLWTVPCISFLTCALVFGYMLVVEGWRGESRTEAITLLDENTGRATSVAWIGVYAPMTPGDGLHFSPASEVSWLKKSEDRYGPYGRTSNNSAGSSCTINWTHDQHLVSGWVSARVPSHFRVRKSEAAPHYRLTVDRAADGTLTATNGLSRDIKQLWLADEKGVVHYAENVTAGAKTTLTQRPEKKVAAARADVYRKLLLGHSWLPERKAPPRDQPYQVPVTMKAMKPVGPGLRPPPPELGVAPPVVASGPPGAAPMGYLAPRTYIAVLDSAPFIESPLAGTRASEARSTVIGIMKDKGDGN